MRITFPSLTLCKGGAQRMLVEIINRLTALGHQVTVVMPSGGVVEYALNAHLIHTSLTVLKPDDFPPADVILSNFYLTVPVSQAASELGKGMHIRLSMCYEPLFLEKQHLSFPTYNTTPRLIVLSDYQKELVRLIHGLEARSIPVGVSEAFRNLRIRQEGNPLQISAVVRKTDGSFGWHRQQDYLFQQLEEVRTRRPEVQINLITPPHEFYSSEEMQFLKETGVYRFYTPADDRELCYHYSQADIFVTSSVLEAALLPGMEAMRCGAALVSVYAGGNLEYCRDGYNCLLSYRYENRLAEDIDRLILDADLRKRLSRNGEADSAAWTWDDSAKQLLEALLEYMKKP